MSFRLPNMHDKMMNNGACEGREKKYGLNKKPEAVFTSSPSRLLLWIFLIEIHSTISHSRLRIDRFGNIVFSSVGHSTVWCAVLWRATNCIFIRNGAIQPTWLWTSMPRSISMTILWIYFLGNSNAIFTAVVCRCYQNVDLKYNLSKWKYIFDKVRRAALTNILHRFCRTTNFFHFLPDFDSELKAIIYPPSDLIAPTSWHSFHSSTHHIDIFDITLRLLKDERKYFCSPRWARNAWVIKASSFRITYYRLRSCARNATTR